MRTLPSTLLATALCLVFQGSEGAVEYYGKYLGPLSRLMHGVSGEVYAVDARTLHIRDFTYDGEGPAAYFYAGNSKAPGSGGFRVRDENGSAGLLKRYRKKHITLTLPEGKTLNNIRWFSVWCEEFSVNFGDVSIPRGLDYPKPQKVGALQGVHAVSSDPVVIVDAQTLLIPSFSYDGEAPDAKFWVGRGSKPSPQGIRVPDENGKQNPLRRYERKTIVLTLPGDLTVFDIGHFGVWCEAFTVDFGHIQLPSNLNVPPSLKMLGVSPQKRSLQLSAVQQQQDYNPQQQQDYNPQQQQQITYENVLPLFNVQQVRPTTYRPPLEQHRFAGRQHQAQYQQQAAPYRQQAAPYQQQGTVQIVPSISIPFNAGYSQPFYQQQQAPLQYLPYDNYQQPSQQVVAPYYQQEYLQRRSYTNYLLPGASPHNGFIRY